MKFSIALIALTSMVLATPPPKGKECKPGTYRCSPNKKGWEVCTVEGEFVFAGSCPPKTICEFFPPSQSPYCVPPDIHFP